MPVSLTPRQCSLLQQILVASGIEEDAHDWAADEVASSGLDHPESEAFMTRVNDRTEALREEVRELRAALGI